MDEAIRQTVADCYRQFGFRVHRRALAILGDEEDARDCTQQVFERLAERLRTFEGRSAIQTWIYVVATREALQIRRARSSRLTREDRWARDAAPSSHPAAADRAEARQLLEVAVLYVFDGLEQAEIGQLLGVSRRTVIRRLNTVRQEAGRLAAAGA